MRCLALLHHLQMFDIYNFFLTPINNINHLASRFVKRINGNEYHLRSDSFNEYFVNFFSNIFVWRISGTQMDSTICLRHCVPLGSSWELISNTSNQRLTNEVCHESFYHKFSCFWFDCFASQYTLRCYTRTSWLLAVWFCFMQSNSFHTR